MPDEDFRNLIWYIFSPPQDKKPFTIEEERKEILKTQASVPSVSDGESVALWNPEWKINAPQFEGTPEKLPQYHGKQNVLRTHPFDEAKAAAIERIVDILPGKTTLLTLNVASHDQGDWELRIYGADKLLKKQVIGHDGARWQTITVDLTPFAGSKIPVRLENKANDWHWEFGYWNDIKLSSSDVQQRAAK